MANLRDIYQYMMGQAAQDTPWTSGDPPSDDWLNSQGQHSAFAWAPNEYGQMGWQIKPDSALGQINAQYAGATAMENRNPGGVGSFNLAINPENLPQTRFGGVDQTTAVDDRTTLANPAAADDDPNYGRITPRGNVRTGNEWLGPTLMAIVGMGAGSLIGATGGASAANTFRQAMAGARGVQALGQRNPLGALGAIGGAFGVPSWATTLARIGLQQRNRRGG